MITQAQQIDREGSVDKVSKTVTIWKNPTSPYGYAQFEQLNLVAVLTPTSGADGCRQLDLNLTLADPAKGRGVLPDVYADAGDKFGINKVPQRRFVLANQLYDLTMEKYRMCRFKVDVKDASSGQVVGSIPEPSSDASYTVAYEVDLVHWFGANYMCSTMDDSCSSRGSNYQGCRRMCTEGPLYGSFCDNGKFACVVERGFQSLCLKVLPAVEGANVSAGYHADATVPGPGYGCNVPDYGFYRLPNTGLGISQFPGTGAQDLAPMFQLENMCRSGVCQRDSNLMLVVRSAYDPWLQYMSVTEASEYFGIDKGMAIATGVVVLIVGIMGTLFWFVVMFYAWKMLCARRRPQERPPGWVAGTAWDLANQYGGQYAPAVGTPVYQEYNDSNGVPTAQPVYAASYQPFPGYAVGQPVAGYPAYGAMPQAGYYPGSAPPNTVAGMELAPMGSSVALVGAGPQQLGPAASGSYPLPPYPGSAAPEGVVPYYMPHPPLPMSTSAGAPAAGGSGRLQYGNASSSSPGAPALGAGTAPESPPASAPPPSVPDPGPSIGRPTSPLPPVPGPGPSFGRAASSAAADHNQALGPYPKV